MTQERSRAACACSGEANANGHRNAHRLAGGGKASAVLIDFEQDEGIGVLVGDDKVTATGNDPEVARGATAGGLVLHHRKRPAVAVDAVHDDAVVPPVGSVNEAAGRVHV